MITMPDELAWRSSTQKLTWAGGLARSMETSFTPIGSTETEGLTTTHDRHAYLRIKESKSQREEVAAIDPKNPRFVVMHCDRLATFFLMRATEILPN